MAANRPDGLRPHDFVLKLFLENDDREGRQNYGKEQKEFRRVRLSQIGGTVHLCANSSPIVEFSEDSYSVVCERAVNYFATETTLKIRLSYRDEDHDWVVLDSTEELIDAIKGVLGKPEPQFYLPIRVKILMPKAEVAVFSSEIKGVRQETCGSASSSGRQETVPLAKLRWNSQVCSIAAVCILLLSIALGRSNQESPLASPSKNLTDMDSPSSDNLIPETTPEPPKEEAVVHRAATKEGGSTLPSSKRTTVLSDTTQVADSEELSSIFSGILAGESRSSPISKAFEWIRKDPHWKRYPKERLLQRLGLVAFFYGTNGDKSWKRSDGWLSYQIHECHWWPGSFSMSICGEDKYHRRGNDWQYERLWLPNNGLEGTLPPKVFQLVPSLKLIRLDKNIWLSGTLPSELGLLTSLQQLWLHHNQLHGTIPSEIGGISTLEKLCLAENDLRGSIPSTMFKGLTNLRKLWLDHNRLTGPIPTQIGIAPLTILSLSHNHFAGGGLPTSLLGSLTELEQLVAPIGMPLSEKQLVPTEIGLLTNLRRLDLFVSPEMWLKLSSHKWERSEVATLYNLESFRVGTLGNDDEMIDVLEM